MSTAITVDEILKEGRLTIDVSRRVAKIDSELLPLKSREFELLCALVRANGRVLSREWLVQNVWGDDYMGDDMTVAVHVRRLRAAFEDVDPKIRRGQIINTVHGVGYRYCPLVA